MHQSLVSMARRSYQAVLEIFRKLEANMPYFVDVFDEETFYIFAACFVIATILMAFVLSKFITLREVDW